MLRIGPGSSINHPMAEKTTTQKAADAARAVASNPYLRRLIEDEELRRNIRDAFDSVRGAGQRLYDEPSPARAIFDDRRIQDELRNAAETIREASDQLRGRKQKRSFGIGKTIIVALVGAVLVLILSETARRAVLDLIFGAEEEFEYNSTPAPENASVPSA